MLLIVGRKERLHRRALPFWGQDNLCQLWEAAFLIPDTLAVATLKPRTEQFSDPCHLDSIRLCVFCVINLPFPLHTDFS